MIGSLSGTVFYLRRDSLVLMVGGVGYLLFCPARLLAKTQEGAQVQFYTYTHVREDMLQLFGFSSREELELFELLLSVSGIGPKTALLVINQGVWEIRQAISKADVSFFTAIPRLGTKNAQKLIIELKSKIGSTVDLDLVGTENTETNEFVEALGAVGFTKPEALATYKLISNKSQTLEEKVREGLKVLGRKRK